MKRYIIILIFTLLAVAVTVIVFYDVGLKGKSLVPKYMIKEDKKGISIFNRPFGLAVSNDTFFVADTGNNRIQVLKINSDGGLIAKSKLEFIGHNEKLGIFSGFLGPLGLDTKNNYLYVSNVRNLSIDVLKISLEGNLSKLFSYVPKQVDKGLFIANSLTIKGNYLYATDPENNCLRVFKIK